MIAIAIISNPHKISGKLTRIFTGSYAYHIGFVDLERQKFYDMNLLFRRRKWPHYPDETVKLYHCPVTISAAMLEAELDESEEAYGVMDYLSFSVKKLFPKRPSFKGAICSEKVEQILVRRGGWVSPFEFVPSPADFEQVLGPL